jgi:exopolysaccharide production protein ExoZ
VSKLLFLQVLRGLAAIGVAAVHAQHEAEPIAAGIGGAFKASPPFPAAAGVDVFFAISGFIMVYASRRLFGTPTGRRVFLAHRIARVIPLYWTVLTLYLVVALAAPRLLSGEHLTPLVVVASYLFIPVARPDGVIQPLYSLGWTLNYEVFYYALFTVAVAWPRAQSLPWLFATFVALAVIGVAVPGLPPTLAFWTDPMVLEFAFGVALALLREEGVRLGGPVRVGLAAVAFVAIALTLAGPEGAGPVPRVLACGVPAAMLVAAAGLGHDRDGEAWLVTRFGALVGDASYALYLFHPFVMRGVRELVVRAGLAGAIGPWGFVGLSLVLATLVSIAIHFLFERPATGWTRRRLERWLSVARARSYDDPAGAAPAHARTDTRASP